MSSQVIATRAAPYILIEMDVGRCRGDWGLLSGVHHHNDNTPGQQLITTPSLDPGDTGTRDNEPARPAPTRNSLDSVTPSDGGGGHEAHYEVRASAGLLRVRCGLQIDL